MRPFTIGRKKELDKISNLLISKKSECLAVYGRRRVGKTHLIKHAISLRKKAFVFELTGLKDGLMTDQLELFVKALQKAIKSNWNIQQPKNWTEAFEMLSTAADQLKKTQEIIFFFDELPWLATQKSGFLQAFDHIWNTDWCYRQNLKVIVCGSAASWMIDNLINAKGGLHNRLTMTLLLRPFDICETKEFLESNKVNLDKRQILEIYLVMGGIPYYLDNIQRGLSATQNIDELCFTPEGRLFNEFDRLYHSLFKNAESYIDIIQAIASQRNGISQEGLIKKLKIKQTGGALSKRLYELEEAGFIISFIPYGHSRKGIYYQIFDEYSLFYLHWIKPVKNKIRLNLKAVNYWQTKIALPSWKAWSGYAFEAFCFKHIDKIVNALKIKVGYEISSWRYIPKNKNEKGAQIDLLIDRNDGILNIVEIKYSKDPYRITKQYATDLTDKIDIFKAQAKVKKQVFLTMVTVDELFPNTYANLLVDSQVTLEDFY